VSRIPRWSVLCALWLYAAGCAWSCNTPVYRYALEHWDPSPYLLIVCHQGAKSPAQERLDELLAPADDGPVSNLECHHLDLARKDDPLRKQLEEALGKTIEELVPAADEPQVLLLWPFAHGRRNGVLWSGPLKDLDLKALVDSPFRHDLARGLLQGQASVWLFVESGDAAADRKAEQVLRDTLKKMEREIELPPQEVDPALIQQEEAHDAPQEPARPTFGLLKLKPGAPEERMFEKLLRLEELWKEKKAPLAFPVYGRGRVLAALADEEIDPEWISEICVFVSGPCSCQVKAGNPGYDLLMTVDWLAGLAGGAELEKALPPLVSPTGLAAAAKVAAEGTPPDAPLEPVLSDVPARAICDGPLSGVLTNALVVVVVLVAVVLAVGFLIRARRS